MPYLSTVGQLISIVPYIKIYQAKCVYYIMIIDSHSRFQIGYELFDDENSSLILGAKIYRQITYLNSILSYRINV